MSTSLVRIPQPQWELHRETITRVYIEQKRTLQGLIDIMRTDYGFSASKAQYERQLSKWNLRKNRKKGQWDSIANIYTRRKLEGKDSDVYINNILVEPAKLRKEMGRHSVPISDQYTHAQSPRALEGVTVCTPPARAATPYFPGQTSELPFIHFESSLYAQASHPMFSETFQGLPGIQHPYNNNALLFSESPSEATSLMEVLNPSVNEQTSGSHHEIAPSTEELSSMLKALRLGPETGSRWGEQLNLIPGYDTHSSAFTRMLLFSIANNFVGFDNISIEKVLGCLKSQTDTGLLQSLQYTQGPESESFAENLFRAAIEFGDAPIVQVLLEKGLDPNRLVCTVDGRRYTPVERSSMIRNTEITKLLIHAKANVNKTLEKSDVSPQGNGALQCSIGIYTHPDRSFPDAGLVQVLLDAGAEVDLSTIFSAVSLRADPILVKLLAISYSKWYRPESSSFRKPHVLAEIIRHYDMTRALELVIFFVERSVYVADEFSGYSQLHSCSSSSCFTPLECAAELGYLELANFLLSHGACLTQLTLSLAIRSTKRDLVHLLLNSGVEVDKTFKFRASSGDYTTPLAEAIRCRDVQMLKLIEDSGTWSWKVGFSQFTAALEAAAEVGELSIIRRLLKTKTDFEGGDLARALFAAICADQEEAAAMLIHAGADVNHPGYWGECSRPLSVALQKRSLKLVRLILDADVLQIDSPGKPCVLLAAEWGDHSILSDLIAMGGDVNSIFGGVRKSEKKVAGTALAVAVRSRDFKMVQLLLRAGAENQSTVELIYSTTALEEAVMNGDVEMVNYLLFRNIDPADSWALLAAVTSQIKMIRLLLAAFTKKYPQGKSGYGSLALQKVIQTENQPALEQLTQCGIDVNGLAQEYTPLGVGIAKDQGKDLEIVKKLLRAGGDPNSIVKIKGYRRTALLVAIQTKSIDMVRLLIDAGADFNRPATMGVKRTPLQYAAEIGSFEIVQLLLDMGCLNNDTPATRGGATALQLAAIGGYVGIAELLLKRGANVNEAPGIVNGRTALEGAAEHGRLDMVALLLNAGASIDGAGRQHYERALELAEKYGHIATRNYLENFSST